VAQNPPLYYALGAAAYQLSPDRSLLGRLFAVRLLTVAMYVLTVVFTWLLTGEVFMLLWQRFLATALVAFQPKLVAMGAVINPDALLFTLCTAFLWSAVRILRRGMSARRVAVLALLAGGSALTHGRGLFLIASLCVVLVVAAIRFRPSIGTMCRFAAIAAGVMAVLLALAVIWTRAASGGAAFGGEVTQSGNGNVRQFLSYVFQFYFGHFTSLQPLGPPYGYRQAFIETFFGGFGSLEVVYSPQLYDYLQIAAGVGLAAFTICVAARWTDVTRLWWLWTCAVGFVVPLLGLLHITAYRDLLVGGDPLITGRYLLPGVALYGVAVAWVVGSLPRRARAPVAAVLLSAAAALVVQGFLILEERFYG
jgi:4-amino-4-deoxy-L-arabinose transferase-like glycosyltransferase